MNTTLVDVKSQLKDYSDVIKLAQSNPLYRTDLNAILMDQGTSADAKAMMTSLSTLAKNNPDDLKTFLPNYTTWKNNKKLKDEAKNATSAAAKKAIIEKVYSGTTLDVYKDLGYSEDDIFDIASASINAVSDNLSDAAVTGGWRVSDKIPINTPEAADKIVDKVLSDGELSDDEIRALGYIDGDVPIGDTNLEKYIDNKIVGSIATKTDAVIADIYTNSDLEMLMGDFANLTPIYAETDPSHTWNSFMAAATKLQQKVDEMSEKYGAFANKNKGFVKAVAILDRWNELRTQEPQIRATWANRQAAEKEALAKSKEQAKAVQSKASEEDTINKEIQKRMQMIPAFQIESRLSAEMTRWERSGKEGPKPTKEAIMQELRSKIEAEVRSPAGAGTSSTAAQPTARGTISGGWSQTGPTGMA
jgi:cell division protein ZapA (FtsZ GTPase activity inhibitor)